VIKAILKKRAAMKLPHLPGKYRHTITRGIQVSLKAVRVLGRLDIAFCSGFFAIHPPYLY